MKNTHNLRLKFRKFQGEHNAPGMKDEVAALGKQIHMAAEGFFHAALDAVALVRLAQDLAGGETHARA